MEVINIYIKVLALWSCLLDYLACKNIVTSNS